MYSVRSDPLPWEVEDRSLRAGGDGGRPAASVKSAVAVARA
jgi:hypothetical protein